MVRPGSLEETVIGGRHAPRHVPQTPPRASWSHFLDVEVTVLGILSISHPHSKSLRRRFREAPKNPSVFRNPSIRHNSNPMSETGGDCGNWRQPTSDGQPSARLCCKLPSIWLGAQRAVGVGQGLVQHPDCAARPAAIKGLVRPVSPSDWLAPETTAASPSGPAPHPCSVPRRGIDTHQPHQRALDWGRRAPALLRACNSPANRGGCVNVP